MASPGCLLKNKNKNDKLLLFIFIMAVLLPLALDATEVLARPALAPKNEGALLQGIVNTFESYNLIQGF